MQVIPPIIIDDTKLTSTTVPETVAATYSAGTTYAEGDRAGLAPVYGSAQTVYESLSDGNIGNALTNTTFWKPVGDVYPVYNSGSSCDIGGIVTDLANHRLYESLVNANTGNALSDTTKWKDIGPTNRYAMFDYLRSTQTSVPLTFTVVITPGKRVNSFALAGMVANSYSLSVSSVSGGGVVYTSSGSLNERDTRTWSEYFFGEFGTQESIVFFDLPPYSDNIVTLTLTATSGNVALGAFIVGTYAWLGDTELQAQSDVLNFSTIERTIDGEAILTQRRNVPKTMQRVWCNKTDVNRIKKVREDLNATPAIWYAVADDGDGYFEILSILGIYKQFIIDAAYPENAVITLELEEV